MFILFYPAKTTHVSFFICLQKNYLDPPSGKNVVGWALTIMEEHIILSKIFHSNIRKHPCMLPVSLGRKMLPKLQDNYIMSPKSDGERAFLFISTDDKKQMKSAWIYLRSEKLVTLLTCEDLPTDPCQLSIFDVEVKFDSFRIEAFDSLLVMDDVFLAHCITTRVEKLRKFIHMFGNLSTNAMVFPMARAAHLHGKSHLQITVENDALESDNREYKKKRTCHCAEKGKKCKNEIKRERKRQKLIALQEESQEKPKPTFSQTTHLWREKIYPTRFLNEDSVQIGKWTLYAKPTFAVRELKNISSCFPDSDGWIFTKMLDRYHTYRSSLDTCLKWKPPNCMTIDFKIEAGLDGNEKVALNYIAGIPQKYSKHTKGEYVLSVVSGSGRPLRFAFGNLPMHFELDSTYDIGEFAWTDNRWRLMKMRFDKVKPNSVETAVLTIHDLESSISLKEITDLVDLP